MVVAPVIVAALVAVGLAGALPQASLQEVPSASGSSGPGETQAAGPGTDLGVAVGAGPWLASPAGDAYPYFAVYGSVVAAQDGRLVLAWFDRALRPTVSIALREPDGRWQGPVELGVATDDHAFPAVAIDASGLVHVVFGGHANAEFPIRYLRSLRPYDLAAWTDEQVLETTPGSSYNNLAVAPDGRLLLTYRRGDPDDGGLILRTKEPGQPWGAGVLLAKSKLASVYPYDLAVDPDGTIHVAFLWREGPAAAWSDPSYMRSTDGGRSWGLADGTGVALPGIRSIVRVAQDDVPHNPGLRLAQDPAGGLHLLYAHAEPTANVFQVKHLAYVDGVGWSPRAGFAASTFPLGYHATADGLRVLATAPGDRAQVVEFTLATDAQAWAVQPLDPLPAGSQLATATGRNVARAPGGLPWTVAATIEPGLSPSLRVARV